MTPKEKRAVRKLLRFIEDHFNPPENIPGYAECKMSEHPIIRCRREYAELLKKYCKARNRIFHSEKQFEELEVAAKEALRVLEMSDMETDAEPMLRAALRKKAGKQ